MEENIINLGEWNCPTKWEDINLKTYSEIERFYEGSDKSFDIREVIHILCDKTVDEVNSLPIDFLDIILEKLSFLQTKPEEKEPSNKIVIKGETYSVNVQNKLKVGEYLAVDTVVKNDPHNYATIMAVLCRKLDEPYDSKFENEILEDRVKLFEEQPVVNILPLINFFMLCYATYMTPTLLSSQIREVISHIRKDTETSVKNGTASKRFMRSVEKKLTKLEKSLDSI